MTPSTSDPRPNDAAQPRFFALDEANRTLPLVRSIVADVLAEYEPLEALLARYRSLDADDRRAPSAVALRAELDERAERIDALVAELHELGCLFKGLGDGLVDWYSLYAGRPVFLCWKLGEPEIGWWHQLDAGFMGRQPILPSQRGAFRSD